MRVASLLTTLLVLGCVRSELRPADDARQFPPGGPAVVDQRAGVRVIANPEGWEGSVTVEEKLLPVELVIDNLSPQAVYFSHGDVMLVGTRHSVKPLAPEKIQRIRPQRTSVGLPPDHIDYEGGDVTLLASVSRANEEETRPAKEARAAAIPDATIGPGERLRGFVYFDELPPAGERLELRVPVRGPEGALVTLSLPFRVE